MTGMHVVIPFTKWYFVLHIEMDVFACFHVKDSWLNIESVGSNIFSDVFRVE